MRKLLSAELVRLFKSSVYRLCLLFSAGLGVFVIVMRWQDVSRHPEEYAKLPVEYGNADGLIFVGALYLVFAMAIFVGIFVGTEYSDGTIRNKLTAGHGRGNIYLAEFFVCAVGNVVMEFVNVLVALILGKLLIGTTFTASQLFSFAAMILAALVPLTALLVAISMGIQSKAVSSVSALVTVLLLFFAAITIYNRLEASEYYDPYVIYSVDGEIVEQQEREKNPNYLTGTKRKVYEFLNDFLPVSQVFQLASNVPDMPDGWALLLVYDGLLVAACTGAGIMVFKVKNIR